MRRARKREKSRVSASSTPAGAPVCTPAMASSRGGEETQRSVEVVTRQHFFNGEWLAGSRAHIFRESR